MVIAMATIAEYEETLYGHEVEVIDVLSELTDEEIDQFEDAGEDRHLNSP